MDMSIKTSIAILLAAFLQAADPPKPEPPKEPTVLSDKEKAEFGTKHTLLVSSRLIVERKQRIADQAQRDLEKAKEDLATVEREYGESLAALQKAHGAGKGCALSADYFWQCPKPPATPPVQASK
jgi:hypothetical protein